MKLSEILKAHYVMPFAMTTIVGFYTQEARVYITWEYDDEEYVVEAEDQKVQFSPNLPGVFHITDDNDEVASFVALTEVNFQGGAE